VEEVNEGIGPLFVRQKGRAEVGIIALDLTDEADSVEIDKGDEGKTEQSERDVSFQTMLWGRGR